MSADNFKNIEIKDVLSSVRSEVTKLQGQGVDIIIASGHAGIDVDKEIAKIEGIDVVVGAHTETFMYTGLFRHLLTQFTCSIQIDKKNPKYLISSFLKDV